MGHEEGNTVEDRTDSNTTANADDCRSPEEQQQEETTSIGSVHINNEADLSFLHTPLLGPAPSWPFNHAPSSFGGLSEELTEQWISQNLSQSPCRSLATDNEIEDMELNYMSTDDLPVIDDAFVADDSPFVSFIEGTPIDRIFSDAHNHDRHQDDEDFLLASYIPLATPVIEEVDNQEDSTHYNTSSSDSTKEGTIIVDAQHMKKWWQHKSFQVVACIVLLILLSMAISLAMVVMMHKHTVHVNNEAHSRSASQEGQNSTRWNYTVLPFDDDLITDEVVSSAQI